MDSLIVFMGPNWTELEFHGNIIKHNTKKKKMEKFFCSAVTLYGLGWFPRQLPIVRVSVDRKCFFFFAFTKRSCSRCLPILFMIVSEQDFSFPIEFLLPHSVGT